jgi:endo-1,4-beta-mannosidase
VIPPTTAAGRDWLTRVSRAVRAGDERALVTVGLHMEDLEEDRNLGPREATEVCDFLSMHGYPIYAPWARGATDADLLPFLARITRWLGANRDVMFTEFGLPTHRGAAPASPLLVHEDSAAAYTAAALEALRRAGCLGAMLWCYSDYDPALWNRAPFDVATHERTFGLWRADGSAKAAVAAVAEFAGAERCAVDDAETWIDIDRCALLLDPSVQLPRLYARYLSSPGVQP